MENKKLKDGIVLILIANILNMVFSIGTNFLLPKYVSVDTYAQIKTYQLILSYAAILQLGFSDGMFLSFGGRDINEISLVELQTSVSTMRAFQAVVALISIGIAILIGDPVLIVAAIAVLPQNVIAYYKNLFQAVGIFDKYSKIMNYTTGLTFAINIILLFFVRSDNYLYYIIGYTALNVFLSVLLEYSIHSLKGVSYSVKYFSWKELIEKVKDGISLLFANFSSILLTSMDRWFTKVLTTTVDFAQYSFAVSIENFLNVAVTPITVTLYNYFCNNYEKEKVDRIRDLIIGFSTLLVSVAFPIKYIIELFLEKYTDSIRVLFLLFAAQIFLIVVRSVYANLYKARKRQNTYFIKMCIVIVLGLVFNYVCYLVYPHKEAFAIGTLLSSIVWLILSLNDFKDIPVKWTRILFLGVQTVAFIVCGELSAIIGFFIYILVILVTLKMFIPNVMKEYIAMVKAGLRKVRIIK